MNFVRKMNIFTPSTLERDSIVVIGKESVGKSQLIASLTGKSAYSANFRGSTVTCDTYQSEAYKFIDTPGIFYRSDSITTKKTLRQLQENEAVLLVVKATDVDRDLADLLPLVSDKRGIVAITFWDKVRPTAHNGHLTGLGQPQTPCPPQQVIKKWSKVSNLTIVTVDARYLTTEQKNYILASLQEPDTFPSQWIPTIAGWQIQPQPTLLEHPHLGWLVAIALLLIPAIIAVLGANSFATLVDPVVQNGVNPIVESLSQLPIWLREILIGQYGLITTSPLLFIWAMPTVVLYALFLGCLLYTSPSQRDLSTSRMPSSA